MAPDVTRHVRRGQDGWRPLTKTQQIVQEPVECGLGAQILYYGFQLFITIIISMPSSRKQTRNRPSRERRSVPDHWFDDSSAIAIYIRLARVFRERIAEGQWKPGQRVATVEELSKQYKVARITVRQALALLSAEGLLSTARGRGTIVARELNMAIDDPTLRRAINDRYNVAPGQTIKVLTRQRNQALPPLLTLDAGNTGKYVHIKRLHLHNGRPFALLHSYVAQDIYDTFPKSSDQKFKIQRLLKEAGATTAVARQEVTTSHATPEVAKLLEYTMGGTLVKLRSWRFDSNHRILYATINQYRGDLFVLDFVEEQKDANTPLPWLIPLTRYR